ncbi:MAG: phage late control D family protein [Lachnospiraceae bacterium]|nr:phage late control D family protein [Lachnospiraceae bacterium]MDE7202012.1 phage late control D family protein [Lachnospiraceae bacterium]
MTVHDNVTVTGAFGIGRLTGFEAHIIPNAHASAVIRGIAEDITDLARWQMSEMEQEVTVSLEGGRILFCGLVESAVWEQEAEEVYRVQLQLISGSTALDREKESRSFQDTGMSYAKIVEKAAASTPGAYCICTAGSGEKPMRPVIQYAETDWEFAKRLASMAGTVVYPETCRHGAYMWMGMPDCSEASASLGTSEYTHGISNVFYEFGGTAAGYSRKSFEYYRVECGEDYRIGADTEYAGGVWKVLEKHVKLVRGEFRFTYLLGKSCLAAAKKTYNPLFAGRSIHGTVIAAGGDSVKLHLEIDKSQEAASAYPYQWVPDTGSVMYCMPETGTTVSLYFPGEDERNAVAVNCIRYNGATCSEMEDTSKRALTTTEGKRLYLEPGKIGLDIKEPEHKVSMEDETGIRLESKTTMNIAAVKGVKLSAKTMTIETTGPLNLLRDPER